MNVSLELLTGVDGLGVPGRCAWLGPVGVGPADIDFVGAVEGLVLGGVDELLKSIILNISSRFSLTSTDR